MGIQDSVTPPSYIIVDEGVAVIFTFSPFITQSVHFFWAQWKSDFQEAGPASGDLWHHILVQHSAWVLIWTQTKNTQKQIPDYKDAWTWTDRMFHCDWSWSINDILGTLFMYFPCFCSAEHQKPTHLIGCDSDHLLVIDWEQLGASPTWPIREWQQGVTAGLRWASVWALLVTVQTSDLFGVCEIISLLCKRFWDACKFHLSH